MVLDRRMVPPMFSACFPPSAYHPGSPRPQTCLGEKGSGVRGKPARRCPESTADTAPVFAGNCRPPFARSAISAIPILPDPPSRKLTPLKNGSPNRSIQPHQESGFSATGIASAAVKRAWILASQQRWGSAPKRSPTVSGRLGLLPATRVVARATQSSSNGGYPSGVDVFLVGSQPPGYASRPGANGCDASGM